MFHLGVQILNYLDDLAGAETKERVCFAYSCLGAVLQRYGLKESQHQRTNGPVNAHVTISKV